MGDLAAGRHAGGLGARHIALELLVDRDRAGHPLVDQHPVGAGADRLLDRVGRVLLGEPRRHDHRDVGRDLADRRQHLRPGLRHGDDERLVVGRLDRWRAWRT